jgi:TonB-dependent receptor
LKGTAKGVFVISFILALLGAMVARAGTIEGTVSDDKSGEVLIGANIRVVGTDLGGFTDIDGKFAIRGVPAGTYSLRVFYTGYTTKVVTGIIVLTDGITPAAIKLEPVSQDQGDALRIDDTYITAERVTNTYASILMERQRSAVIGDAISAEQIRLSPDGTSSEVLKRVTGLSIVDDKFVFVRGVTDRYNSTTLNGATVTGTDTDADKKSFNFDLIPSQLINNTVVVKAATPDLPGDFSGGLVQVSTLDFPSDFLLTAGAEVGHDEVSSKQGILVAPGGDEDWKAKDDGSRALPPDLEGDELAQALSNTWGTSADDSRRNQSYGLAIGDRYGVGGGEIGFIASGTYKNNYKVEEYAQAPIDSGDVLPIFEYDGYRYKHRYQIGGLLNLTYLPWHNHKFSFENNYSRSAEDKVAQAAGIDKNTNESTLQTIEWDQRDLYLGQAAGSHTFDFLRELGLDWRWSYSTSKAQEPDRKYVKYQRLASGIFAMQENYRTWSELEETSRSGMVDLSSPVGKGRIKAGYSQTERERSFNIEAWQTDATGLSRPYWGLVALPIDTIFSNDHYGPGKFHLKVWTPFSGDYDGTHTLRSYYGMADIPFAVWGQGLRFAGGIRVEDFEQEVNSPVAIDDPTIRTSRIDKTDALPSANITYQVTNTSNLRLSYFASVNRPEFREMANVYYFDMDENQGVIGNPDLRRAFIRNYDVRAEWFPGVGEVVAASWFYKDLTDAIEERLLPNPDRFVRTWFNSPEGKNYGFELEARKNLGFFWDSLENLLVQGNFTRVKSEIQYQHEYTVWGKEVSETRVRTMQGQAPYTVNVGIIYSIPQVGLSTSLLYGRFGRRLDAVGDVRERDIYEEARDVYDFALTEQFTPWARLKFTVKDMAAQDLVKTFGSTGSIWEKVKVGPTYAISLSFNL